MIDSIEKCLADARMGVSKLTPEALQVRGMCASTARHCLNNLCARSNTSYLEIGCWAGATLIAALFGNRCSVRKAYAIENFSLFGGPREEFLANLESFRADLPDVRFFEEDCFSFDRSRIDGKIDVFFYDGEHTEKSQKAAFTYFDPVLEDRFVAVVDDWDIARNGDGRENRRGTLRAFQSLGYRVVESWKMRDARKSGKGHWKEFAVFVIEKPAIAGAETIALDPEKIRAFAEEPHPGWISRAIGALRGPGARTRAG